MLQVFFTMRASEGDQCYLDRLQLMLPGHPDRWCTYYGNIISFLFALDNMGYGDAPLQLYLSGVKIPSPQFFPKASLWCHLDTLSSSQFNHCSLCVVSTQKLMIERISCSLNLTPCSYDCGDTWKCMDAFSLSKGLFVCRVDPTNTSWIDVLGLKC